jgi:SNF2 family DNA or RNA helicase
MREFAKWVPHLRVVPLQGSKKSRDIIRKYELFSSKGELKWLVMLLLHSHGKV